jgi:hypothetical protein
MQTQHSPQAFHSHAFNSKSLILWGQLNEHMIDGKVNVYKAGQIVTTLREHFHMVKSVARKAGSKVEWAYANEAANGAQ